MLSYNPLWKTLICFNFSNIDNTSGCVDMNFTHNYSLFTYSYFFNITDKCYNTHHPQDMY